MYVIGVMSNAVTVNLPSDLTKELDTLKKRTGKTKSQIVRDALRRQLSLERFRSLRQKAVPLARKAGITTDEDVYRRVS